MDRKAVIAFIIIGLVIVFYPYYLKWISPPAQEVTSPVQQELPGREPVSPDLDSPSVGSGLEEPTQPGTTIPALTNLFQSLDSSAVSRDVTVDTDLYRAVLSTKGGTITSWKLKSFEGVGEPWVELLPGNAEGALGITVPTVDGDVDFSDYVFRCDTDHIIVNENRPEATVRLDLEVQNGIRVEKVLRFVHGSYSVDMDILIEGMERLVPTKKYELAWEPGLMTTEKNVKEDMQKMVACALMGSDLAKFDVGKDSSLDRREEGTCSWLGVRNKYFLAAMIPRTVSGEGIRVLGTKQQLMVGNDKVDVKNYSVGLTMPLNSDGLTRHAFEVYLGPQSFNVLQAYGVGLEKCMDMGWTIIRPISRVILAFFVFMHRFIPNYGVIIIIFSILLKVLFYPLTHKQLESTRKMQEVQPQLAKLKEKYKNDPQRLNKETMALYKEAGANPLGGCFPLLLQMPVFFALFSVFRSTIELRRADFFLWIQDLSVKDPYLVLPIIMAVTMFIQQKMTMKDPKQAAMVYMMPAIMFFFFMNFASGLVLYWTVFNLLSIVQQVIIERRKQPPAAAQVS